MRTQREDGHRHRSGVWNPGAAGHSGSAPRDLGDKITLPAHLKGLAITRIEYYLFRYGEEPPGTRT